MEAEYISEVARAHGMPLEAPVVIVTDFLANALVSRRQGTTIKVRHQHAAALAGAHRPHRARARQGGTPARH